MIVPPPLSVVEAKEPRAYRCLAGELSHAREHGISPIVASHLRKDVFHGLNSPWKYSPYGPISVSLDDRSAVRPVGAGALEVWGS